MFFWGDKFVSTELVDDPSNNTSKIVLSDEQKIFRDGLVELRVEELKNEIKKEANKELGISGVAKTEDGYKTIYTFDEAVSSNIEQDHYQEVLNKYCEVDWVLTDFNYGVVQHYEINYKNFTYEFILDANVCNYSPKKLVYNYVDSYPDPALTEAENKIRLDVVNQIKKDDENRDTTEVRKAQFEFMEDGIKAVRKNFKPYFGIDDQDLALWTKNLLEECKTLYLDSSGTYEAGVNYYFVYTSEIGESVEIKITPQRCAEYGFLK